jgi:soluble lytic murein transglycosylase-like protein
MMKIFHDIGQQVAARLTVVLPLAMLSALPAFSAENAILSNGFRIHAERHEVSGEMVKLFTGDGFTQMPLSQIVSFEQEDYVAPPPAPAPATPAPAPVVPPPILPEIDKPLDPRRLADEAARRNNLPEALIRSIMRAESGFQPNALSPKGAIGLMQLMPATAQSYGADPRDPAQNVEAGAAYLRELLIKYDGDARRALAAYNAGPGAVDRYKGVPPYRETQTYIERVLRKYKTAGGE